jgi:hypothetical protein
MDFLARKKISLSMSLTVLDSLPFPRFSAPDETARSLASRALLLTCTAPEMNPLWDILAKDGWVAARDTTRPVPGVTNEEARLVLVAEIEAIVAHNIYGLSREQVEYILETFPIVKRRDTQKYGRFRTKELILAAYDGSPSSRAGAQ